MVANLALTPRQSFAVVDELTDLTTIYGDDINVAVFTRGATELARLMPAVEVDAIDVRVRTRDVAGAVAAAMTSGALQSGGDALIADIALLAEIYRDLTGYEELGVRLTTSERPMCPRFHVDNVTLRLLCTYLGPGTEWLDDADVDRRKLGPGAMGLPDCTSGVMRPGSVVRRMNALDIGLFKGKAWEGFEERGAVHRSPDGTGKRLVLSIDGVD